MKKNKKLLLFSDNYETIKEQVIQYLTEEGQDASNEKLVFNYINNFLENNADDIRYLIKRYDEKNNFDYILVVGSLGLWYGDKPIKATFNTLQDAIDKTFSKTDERELFFNKINATLTAECIHHDGVNIFKFYKVVNGKKHAIKYSDIDY